MVLPHLRHTAENEMEARIEKRSDQRLERFGNVALVGVLRPNCQPFRERDAALVFVEAQKFARTELKREGEM